MSSPRINTFTLGDYQTNCFVVQPTPEARECWIVDCGYEPEPLLQFVTQEQLRPMAVVLTHCHSDHIAGLDEALQRFGPLPVYCHETEAGFCSDPMLNLSGMAGRPIAVTEPDQMLKSGDTLTLGATQWRVLHSPGHSPGGILLVHDESDQAIVGDTIFAGSIGRHDFPTSSVEDLRRSLHEVVMSLPDSMAIHPGHGPSSTIGRERASNPFLMAGAF